MDKETLSNYGWIVICVLVLSVLIALATPFGTFVSDAVQNTTEGLFKTEQNAMEAGLEAAGIELEDVEFDDVATVKGNKNNNSVDVTKLAPGLYDENYVMTMSWEELIKKDKNIPCTLECGTVFNSILNVNGNGELLTSRCCLETETSEFLNGILVLDSSVKKIGNSAIMGCDGLTELVIPNSVTAIDFCGCSYNSNLKAIYLPDSLTTFDTNAFAGCSSLTTITIPASVQVISCCAFGACENLTTINMPNTITTIEVYAFNNCINLSTINFAGTKEQWNDIVKEIGIDGPWNRGCPQITVHCTDGDVIVPVYVYTD